MVTDPGRSFLGAFNSALAFGARRPDPALGAQRLADANRLVTINQAQAADFALQGTLKGDLGVEILNNSDPGGRGTILSVPDNVDVTRLGQVIGASGAVNKYFDKDGNVQTAKSVRVVQAPGGAADSYIVEVERQDGVFAPKTVGASEDPNDSVRIFTGAELRDLSNATLSGLVVDSGRDVFQGRLLALAGENRIEAEAISAANQMAEMNPAMAGQFLQTFRRLPYEGQIGALQEFGVDTDAILADANNAQTSTSTQGTAAGFPPLGDMSAVTAANTSLEDLRDQIGKGRRNRAETKLVNTAKKDLDNALEALPEIQKLREDQAGLPRNKPGSQQRARISAQIKRRKDEIIAELNTPLDANNSVTGTNNQRVRLNDEEIQTALRQQILNPTQEDYAVMRNFLAERGIRTFSQVQQGVRDGTINKENQVRLAALIALAQPTLTAGAAKAKSPLDAYTAAMTEMEPGRMTPKDRATLGVRRDELNLSQANRATDADNLLLEERNKMADLVDKQALGLFRNAGDGDGGLGYLDVSDMKMQTSGNTVNRIARQAGRGTGPDSIAASEVFYEALANDLGAFAQQKGAQNWGDFFMQWFQRTPEFLIGGAQARMAIRNVGGVKSLVFKNADGRTDQNFTIPFSELKTRYNNAVIAELERTLPPERAPQSR